MERFRPDNWWEALLRPVLLADPAGGLYLEVPAPDLRFLFLVLAAIVVFASKRGSSLTSTQVRASLGLTACFYVWTATSGNGRYFLPGLLFVGPLTVVFILKLPGSCALRTAVLTLAGVLQLSVVVSFIQSNPWAVARVSDGTNLRLDQSPLRNAPAVMFTIGGNAHSALVPLFHQESRWSNLGGHYQPHPGGFEDTKLQSLLSSPLPKYAVLPMKAEALGSDEQPSPEAQVGISEVLSSVYLRRVNYRCETIKFRPTSLVGSTSKDVYGGIHGFWFCPVQPDAKETTAIASQAPPNEYIKAVANVELSCPRFFPPGGGRDSYSVGVFVRHYSGADTQLRVTAEGWVFYEYYRSFAAMRIGRVQEVAEGIVTVPCKKLAGRYQVPWQRE